MSWDSDLQEMHDADEKEWDEFMAGLIGSLWTSYDNDIFMVMGRAGVPIDYWTILSAREGVAKITFGFLMNQKRIE